LIFSVRVIALEDLAHAQLLALLVAIAKPRALSFEVEACLPVVAVAGRREVTEIEHPRPG
jgi:hypothetical protein